MSKAHYFALFWCVLLAFTACQNQPTPTPTSVAQLPTATATATSTAVAPTPTNTNTPPPTNTPDRVATALARHPTNTPRPTSIPTPIMYSFSPFFSGSALTNTHPAPLLPLVDHRDGSILVVGSEDNFVYFNVGVRLVKMDVNRPGVPLATAGPLPLLPQEMIALNSIVYLLFPDQTIVAYSVTDTWQPIAKFTAAHPVLRFFEHEQQLYLHLETESGEELVWLSPTLETEQTLALPPHTLTHDLPWLYQLQRTDGNITHVAQANLTEPPLTFTSLLPFPDGSNYNSLFAIDNFLYIPTAYPFDEQVFVYQIQNNSLVKIAEEELSLAEISTRQGDWLADEFNFGDAGSCAGRFTIWDVSTPAAPQEVDSYGSYTIADVWLQPPLAYGSDASSLVQVDTEKKVEQSLWQSTGYVADVAYTPGWVWAINSACDNGSLFQYEVVPPINLRHQHTLPAWNYLYADDQTVYSESGYVYGVTVVQMEPTLETFYVQADEPQNELLGMTKLIQGHYAIVDFMNEQGDPISLIYDTTNPLKWELVSQITITSFGAAVWEGNFIYVGGAELSVIDVTEVGSPIVIAKIALPIQANPQAAGNGFLYAIPRPGYGNELNQLVVYDVQNPANPFLLTTFALPEPAHTMKLDGTTGYILGDDLWVYDLSNPAAPQLIAYYPTPGRASGLLVTDTAVYLADGDAGILVFEKPSQE